jgi:hypothetical protein
MLDLLIMLESALALGDVDHQRMETLLASTRPGVRMLREVWRRATGKSESPGETIMQQFHLVMEVPFEAQAELYDEAGNFVARGDILITGTVFVHEYDGEHHRDKDQQKADLRRGRGLAGTSYVRKGFVLDDLLNHPIVMMHELDRALGRPHDIRRLQCWRQLVDNSLYSPVGRERIMNRWRRQRGIVDWIGGA